MMGLKRAPRVKARTGLPGTEAELPEDLLSNLGAGLPVSRTTLRGSNSALSRVRALVSLRLCVKRGAAGVGESVCNPKPTRLTRLLIPQTGLKLTPSKPPYLPVLPE